MKAVYITLLLLITSCNKNNCNNSVNYFVEDALRREVDEWFIELRKAGVDVKYGRSFIIVLSNLKADLEGAAGVAYGMDDDKGVFIRIDISNWSRYDVNLRRWLIWHELGHDVFNLEHEIHTKCKIMFPAMPYKVTNLQWLKYKNQYIAHIKSKQNGNKKT